MGAPHLLESRSQVLSGDIVGAENGPGSGSLLFRHRQQQVLGADIGVIEFPCLRVSPVEDALDLTTEARLHSTSSLGGESADLPLHLLADRRHVEPCLLKQRLHHALVLCEQRRQEVGIVYDRIASAPGQLSGVTEGLLGLDCQSFWSNHRFLTCAFARPCRRSPGRDWEPESRPSEWQGVYRDALPV